MEELKFFDPSTQLTKVSINNVTVLPISEILLNTDNINLFKYNYRKIFGNSASQDEFFQSISEGIHYPGFPGGKVSHNKFHQPELLGHVSL